MSLLSFFNLSHADRSQREKRALRLERLCRMVENAITVPGKLKEQLLRASAVIFSRMAHCFAQKSLHNSKGL